MKPSDFIHPEDAAALRQLESIPGFPTLVKKFYALGYEKLQYGLNMATSIRLSETQLPELYHLLPPICQQLGISEPEFYLTMDPYPNAWTFGDTKIFITITSGLVEMMTEEEIKAVIAHECGHIICRHVLYHNMANYLLDGVDSLGIIGALSVPIKYALLYWQRKSELSCDRVSSIITTPEVTANVMARLSGGPRSITSKVNFEEWAKQADEYEKIRTDGLWNKTLQIYAVMEQDHPFTAVRVREVLKWAQTDQFKNIKSSMTSTPNGLKCPNCHQDIDPTWGFCQHCGTKLK